MKFAVIAVALLLATRGSAAPAGRGSALEVKSPNGQARISVEVHDFAGVSACPVYTVSSGERTVITPSRLGFDVKGAPFMAGLSVVGQVRRTVDTSWRPLYGEREVIPERYSELTIQLAGSEAPHRRVDIVMRAYDEGVAFCYVIPKQDGSNSFIIDRETTEFRMAGDYPAWATYTAQGVYTNVPLSQLRSGCERPLVIQAADDQYIALAEARLVDYARMKLGPLPKTPRSLVSELGSPVQATLPCRTPWRVVMLANSPARLLENNYLILNLNDPCALTNTSWIHPGKVLRETTLTTVGGKACVDFAVRQNIRFILLDAGWYGPENSPSSDARAVKIDPARYKGPLDLPEVLRYAKQNGIGVILYVNHRALEKQLDELLPLYHEWGVQGIKFGFVNVGPQEWTRWLHESIAKAANYQLMADVHDEYRPTGWSRTYPNFMTMEGVRGDEERQPNRQGLTTFFTRFLAGPADNTICYYDDRVDRFASHAFQLAKMVCFYSPWQCVFWYDRPGTGDASAPGRNIIGDEPELEFFKQCPTVWDETRVLRGEIGEYGIVARRSGRQWFIGFMNANQPRNFDVPLDFLDAKANYIAHLYSDAPQVDTRTHVRIERRAVKPGEFLRLAASAQGGQAVRLEPVSQ